MRKRPLGATPLQVTELGLGTWGLCGDAYGPVPEEEQDRVIDRALAMGIRLFETADVYAEGAMERRLGQRLAGVSDAVVVTKIGTRRDTPLARKDFSIEFLREAFAKSEERLARRIDCLLLHNPSRKALERPELAEFCKGLQSDGRIVTWGASVGDGDSGRAAIDAGAPVLQLAYNVFHARDLIALENDIEAKRVGVLARSVLAHGLLCGFWPPDKVFPSKDHRSERWNNDELRTRIVQLNALRPTLSATVPSLRAVALRFALANERVSALVLGPRNVLQLDQLVRESGKEPPYLDEQRLRELRERLFTIGVPL